MKTPFALLFAILLLVTVEPAFGRAEEDPDAFDDFEELDLENLLDQVVTTASRHEQRLDETPISITVITAEDIRNLGATTIPDVLRTVPGIDVAATTLTGVNVSARGMNELSANTMLVLVDGRSVYAEFYGYIMWDHLSISIDEIERIEVTKSPGSALYGANAFAGVINIITKEPEDMPRLALRSTMAEYGSNLNNILHSGGNGEDFSYKITGGLSHIEEWERTTQEYVSLPRFNALARYRLENGSTLSFSGGRTEGTTLNIPSSLGGAIQLDGINGYLRADYEKDDWHLRAYWNHIDLDIVPEEDFTFNPVTGLKTDNVDLELQHSRQIGENHLLIWGGSYRHNFVKWSILEENYTQDLFSASAYDEWRVAEPLVLSLGVRYDYHPLVKSHVSPRASLVYHPRRKHTFRASVGRAHRNPTYVESYFEFEAELAQVAGLPIKLTGNQDLGSEQITSFEVGYQGQLARGLIGSIDLYHNQIRDLVEIAIVDTYDVPPAAFPGIPSTMSFLNDRDIDATGGEVAIEWRPRTFAGAKLSYAFVTLEDPETGGDTGHAPAHKINAGFDLDLTQDFHLNLFGRYVSTTKWSYLDDFDFVDREGGDFFSLDVHARYQLFPDRLELSVGGRNLLDERYQEYPAGMQFRSQVYATVDVRF